jgi:hypothetical protein
LACDGQCLHGLQGSHRRPLPIATAPAVLRIDRF